MARMTALGLALLGCIFCVLSGYKFTNMYGDGTRIWIPHEVPPHKMLNRKFSGEQGEEICDIKQNFMFVKVHKAGGTTATCIFQRFGYEHNLTFVLPMNRKSDVGWPHFLKKEDFIPSADGEFNVLVDHTVYHRELLQHIMPKDTVYFATLRHPLDQLRSTFNWYGLARKFRLKGADPVASFLKDPKKFHIPFVTPRERRAPHTISRNFMAYDLGFPLGLFDDQSFVDEYVQKISREIDLVIILEHFQESLVLLRRMMCWKLKDILYNVVPKNLRSYKKPTTNSASLVEAHRRWSNVDYELYDHFNATLWQKIQNEDGDFQQEVRHFENVLDKTAIYCNNALLKVGTYMSKVNETAGRLTIPRTAWHDEFEIDPYLCLKLKMEWQDWEYVLKKKHNLMTRNGSSIIKSNIQYNVPKTLDKTLLSEVFNIT
ncbi:galactose-3-O-sulfotransferase 2-like [Branchiostoma floridae x Branchiostoma belcheri]